MLGLGSGQSQVQPNPTDLKFKIYNNKKDLFRNFQCQMLFLYIAFI